MPSLVAAAATTRRSADRSRWCEGLRLLEFAATFLLSMLVPARFALRVPVAVATAALVACPPSGEDGGEGEGEAEGEPAGFLVGRSCGDECPAPPTV